MTNKDSKFSRLGSRTKARRRAVDILYEAEFRDIDPVEIVEDRITLSKDPDNRVNPVPEYTQKIVEGVAVHLDAIDEAIAVHLSSEWRLDRLPAVERAVLRVSSWELMFHGEDVPRDVAVKEGIQLAAAYSHVKASSYVNAVLDGVARDIDIKAADAAVAAREADGPTGQAEDFNPEVGDFIVPEDPSDT
ncbi:transcription antitermination factor NusB [Corynebacterium sp. 320]|uniref:Transcription antitermination protein NusB n=1 Tax=Corynebacterium zhongnanshanii TaxID=2768834 RepID=A0ABQ6VG99_9CORY|nr:MULTISPECIES: transcription antitermination factor NusB [Corynebacterium]KAB1503702.1 transcription antitermination factor NusB [Corynebacterium sp. 320]KAB1553197.1 transcription antitermination factor NusB [Corynebacterium sp. 321]KAB1553584.1 transcription antitermination factor NusB [Corynebacterium sp. 319]KAB3523447.1 transcription antitermination factor NusB [Corynebacterium zhongnanshanii]KAB3527838.1 transcription antitermination factor NusB [Corynebacterium sp. 250]